MKTYRFSLILLGILLIPCWVIAAKYEIDFVVIYETAKNARLDLSKIYTKNASQLGRWFYPPASLLVFYPFGLVSFPVSKWIWIALQTLAYGVFWFYFYHFYSQFKEKKYFWAWVLVFIISINPIHNNFQSNNIQLMLIAMMLVAEDWTKKDSTRQVLSGLLIAVASWIKIFPAFIAVYYMLVKSNRVKAGILLGGGLGLIAPFLVFGVSSATGLYLDFYKAVTTYGNENSLTISGDINCLPALLAKFFTYVVPLAPTAISLITKILTVFLSGVFFFYAYSRRKEEGRVSLHLWAMALALMAFINPSTRPHYFIFYVPAFASVLEFVWPRKAVVSLGLVGASVLLVAFTTDAVLGKKLNDRVEFLNLPTLGLFVISSLLVFWVMRSKSEWPNTELSKA